jgi:hypothetical protein
MATADERVEQYLFYRNRLKEMDDRHEAERSPLVQVLSMLSGWLQKFLDDAKVDSVKSKHGTFYKSTRYTASLEDAEAFMRHVIGTGEFELLDRKANATAVKAFVEEHKTLPPGVKLTPMTTVGVRKGKE